MTEQTSRRPRGWLLAALILASAIGGYLLWHSRGPVPDNGSAQTGQPVPVQIATVESADFPRFLPGLGTVQAFNTVLIRSRVDGQIEKLGFEEGQLVSEGDLIAQIDPRPYQATLAQAKAKKQQDEASLQNAKLDLARYDTLGTFSSAQQKDTQQSLVEQLTAQVAADDASIASAQTELDYTTIRAPVSGRAGFRQVDVGNIVNAASTTGIVTIAQIEPISAVFTAPEDQLPEIAAALREQPLTVIVYSSDGSRKLSEGQLRSIDNQVDTASGTIQLKAVFANKDHALWPGLSVSTQLLVATLRNAIVIPEDAVQRGPNGLYAYLVGDDSKAQMQPITVSDTNDGRAVVTSGLRAGQKVVTAGQYRVQPGALVSSQRAEKATVASESK